MLFHFKNNSIQPMYFYDYSDFQGKEKDLENLLAEQLGNLYVEDSQLMPIFQERQMQEEPDLCALDKNGDMVIFELKRGTVLGDTTIQVMRYAQLFGKKSYAELNRIYQKYTNSTIELLVAHAEAFQMEIPLKEEQFNKKQKLVIVGSSSDVSLIEAVEYWKSKGLDIDFLPYRFYKINGEIYFEFFAKPYDYHLNPKARKGIMFDTNKSYDANAVWDMLKNEKISAYGKASRNIDSFNKGDYVLYYHIGYGIIAAGKIKSSKPIMDNEGVEKYHKVELLTPAVKSKSEIRCISAREIKEILGKNFYYANTIKSPYLSVEESEKLINILKEKYSK